jgi:peptidoglycan/xylan/chitin deacetylase (PgdA/CDA1 family)
VCFDDGLRSLLEGLPLLKRLGVPATIFVCTGFVDDSRPFVVPALQTAAVEAPEELETLGWDELRSLADGGVEIGSHSVTHRHLDQLSDAELARELRESKERIEDRIGLPCSMLAYPYGAEDVRVRAAARAAGYKAAFGAPGQEVPIDAFSLPRLVILREDRLLRMALRTTRLGREYAALARRRRVLRQARDSSPRAL